MRRSHGCDVIPRQEIIYLALFVAVDDGRECCAQVTPWKRQAIEGLTGVFSDKIKRAENNEAKLKNCTPGSGGLQLKMIFCHKGSKDEPDKTQGNDQQGSHRS